MLEPGSDVIEVWFETHDDFVLIHNTPPVFVEYIQVKSNELTQLWTISRLIDGQDDSLLVKSFNRDCYLETAHFGIATLRDVHPELAVLKEPLGTVARAAGIPAIAASIDGKLPSLTSPNGNGIQFWLTNARWYVKTSIEEVTYEAKLHLSQLCNLRGWHPQPDQLDELVERLLLLSKEHADKKYIGDGSEKKVGREAFQSWLNSLIDSRLNATGGSKPLITKLEAAGAPGDVVKAALEHRRNFNREIREPKYASTPIYDGFITTLNAELSQQRLRYLSGELALAPLAFLNHCANKACEQAQDSNPPIPKNIALGSLYDTASRCLLAFTK